MNTPMSNRFAKMLLVLLGTGTSLCAQYINGVTEPDRTVTKPTATEELAVKYANSIQVEDLRRHLTKIASSDFEGRETGTAGNEKSALYLANAITNLGLQGGGENGAYFQFMMFTFFSWEDTDIWINGERYKHLWDYISYPAKNENRILFEGEEVVFLGYGIEDEKYNDYKGKKLEGKIILINKGEPMKNDSISWITGTTTASDWATNMDRKLKLAKSKGVKLVLIIEDDIKKLLDKDRSKLLGATVELGEHTQRIPEVANHVFISTTLARAIIGVNDQKILEARKSISQKGKPKDVILPAKVQMMQKLKVRGLAGNNVLAFVEGKSKKDEIIVVSAHHDHLGKRGDNIFHGADDNGSGTTALLELAEAFGKAAADGNGPERSILFLWVTGEEKGLLGSEYFVENPTMPLEQMMVNVNVDMVGRVDEKYEGKDPYIYVIGSDRLSKRLHAVNEEVNQKYSHLTLDYTYNDEADKNRYYYRSDHYNFAKNGIPAIFFFNGVHKDYHQPSDTIEKINFPMMEARTRHIFHLIWTLANGSEKIQVDTQ